MRANIVHDGADKLSYEIREIVEVAKKIEDLGIEISWENIGDPVAKGEKVPKWIKDIIIEIIEKDDSSFGYSPTRGLLKTREYIAHERNIEGGAQISHNDILFFNGLGDAISKIYGYLNEDVRVIGPNPAYPTHSSAEAAHADAPHITYKLDPKNGWEPDLDDLYEKVKSNPNIGGILIINPDNPTGYVYPSQVMQRIVDIAKEFDCFVISDEIYSNLFYGTEHKKLAQFIGDVPGIAMRGVSKEFPWPGARCGWLEFYNTDKDKNFAKYAKSLVDAKMLEVCSTTLPQKALPLIMGDSRYYPYLEERNLMYQKKSEIAHEILSEIPGVIVNKSNGAFYMTVVFEEGVLNSNQRLDVLNKGAFEIIKPLIETKELDKRFVYFLLASKGICVVPLSSGFNSNLFGFRMTILEKDEANFRENIENIAEAIREYTAS